MISIVWGNNRVIGSINQKRNKKVKKEKYRLWHSFKHGDVYARGKTLPQANLKQKFQNLV